MVLTELRPESWTRATCSVCCCPDRCQGASVWEGTNYRTAAQQTLTLPWGKGPSLSLARPPTRDPRPGTIVANSSPSQSRELDGGTIGVAQIFQENWTIITLQKVDVEVFVGAVWVCRLNVTPKPLLWLNEQQKLWYGPVMDQCV